MFTKLIVYAAYQLKSSSGYQRIKHFAYDLLENPNSRIKSAFDIFMIGLIISSVVLLLYNVQHQHTAFATYFEQTIVSILIAEYLLRGWLYSDSHRIVIEQYEKAQYLNVPFSLTATLKLVVAKKIDYVLTPLAIIDLLAILPSYRSLQILRIFLIFRLFKLFRYSSNIKIFSDVLASKRFELTTLLMFLCFLVFISSSAMYLFENVAHGGQVRDMFDAIYWSVTTLSTVGYGDITPQTIGGRLVAMALILTGLGVIAFLTSILVTAFTEKMHTLRENRVFAELDRYKNFTIICGYGRVGKELARRLARDKQKFIIIDKKEINVAHAKQQGFLVIQDDASKNEVLIRAGINRGATTVICTTGNDVINVYITLTSRYLNRDIRIISRANRQDNMNKLYQAGADNVVLPFEIAGMLAAEYLGQPVAFEAISGILQNEKHVVMETIGVGSGSLADSKTVGELALEQRKLTLLGVISADPVHLKHRNKYQVKHQHFYFNPDAHFKLREQDILVLFGRKLSIDHFRNQVEQSRLLRRSSR